MLETARTRTPPSARPRLPGLLRRDQHDGGAAVGGGADVEQVQRIGDDRRVEHLLDRHLLAVPGPRVGQAVAGVLDLDGGEVLGVAP